MATVMVMCRLNFGPNLKPVAVRFVHPEPFCGEKYSAFFNGPDFFDTATDSLTLRKKDADQRLPGGNPHPARLSDRIIIGYLSALHSYEIVNRTQAAIVDLLPSGVISD